MQILLCGAKKWTRQGLNLRPKEIMFKLVGINYFRKSKTGYGSPQCGSAMLQAFKDIYLSVVTIGEQVLYHVTPLSDDQAKILALLDFLSGIFAQLANNFSKPAS
jgi:hypothetical protein